MSDSQDLNKVKNAVATICSNDLLKLLKEYQKENSENKTKIMFMKYFTTCRVTMSAVVGDGEMGQSCQIRRCEGNGDCNATSSEYT